MPDPEPTAGMPSAAPDGAESPVLHSTRLPPAATASLHDTLEDQTARTGELRDALDELRSTLETPADTSAHRTRLRPGSLVRARGRRPGDVGDDAPGPVPDRAPAAVPPAVARPAPEADEAHPRRHHTRHRRLALAVLALVAGVSVVTAAAVAGTTAGRRRTDGAGSPARATSTPAATPSPGPSPAPPTEPSTGASSQAPPAAPATHPLPWPGGAVLVPPGLPRGGPGADAPGSELTAAIDPDGMHVDVYERAVLRPGTTSVLLAPAPAAGLPEVLRDLRPSVEDLQAEVDGHPVVPTPDGEGWRVSAPGGGVVTRVVLRYRVGGSLVRQEPAPPGRASLLLRPLSGPAAQAAADPVVVRIDDRRVGALYCPAPRPALCAASAGTVLTATVPPGAAAVVLAQVTL